MATIAERLEAATAAAEEASDKINLFLTGDDETTIPDTPGPLPSLAKFLKDEKEIVEGQVAEVASDVFMARTQAQSAAVDAGSSSTAALSYRNAALAARDAAQSYRDTAQSHATAAGNAKTAAESAQAAAEEARDDAIEARAGAESARDEAVTTSYNALRGVERVLRNRIFRNWLPNVNVGANSANAVVRAPEIATYMVVGQGVSLISAAYESTDGGFTWTSRQIDTGRAWKDVCWAPEISTFCAVTDSSSSAAATTPGGTDWTLRTTPSIPGYANGWARVAWSPKLNMFLAISSGTYHTMRSTDGGATWTLGNTGGDASGKVNRAVCWCDEIEVFVVAADFIVGGLQYSYVSVSSDGINWTNYNLPFTVGDQGVVDICWSRRLSRFFVLGVKNISGTNRNVCAASNLMDPTAWQSGNVAVITNGSNARSICSADDIGCIVAAGLGTPVWFSADGKFWQGSPHTLPSTTGRVDVCWAEDISAIAIVGGAAGVGSTTSRFAQAIP